MKHIFILILAAFPIQLLAQTDSIKREGPTEHPFQLDTGVARGYYGPDDRKEATDAYGFQDFVRATAAMVQRSDVQDGYITSGTLRDFLSEGFGSDRFADNVNFLDQPACSECTGFLIAPDILVTAGHCIKRQADCDNYAWIFDYTTDRAFSDGKLYIDNTDVYYCKEILHRILEDDGGDWAVLRLDRPSDRDPYRFRISGKIAENVNVYMIGAPSGLPLKLADNAKVTNNDQLFSFQADLDAFGGNSGGPVFDRAGWIEGILVSGLADFEYDQWTDMVRVAEYSEGLEEAENVMRITGLPRDILMEAIYNNIEYGIRMHDSRRLQKWLIYGGIIDHPYTQERGRFEDIALEADNVEALELLAAHTDELKVGNDPGKGLLHYAITKNHMEYLEDLLINYSPNRQDAQGRTSLFWAIDAGNHEALSLLIEAGADPDIREFGNGESALHHAIRAGDLRAVELLLKAGADLDLENEDGKDACHLAHKLRQKDIKRAIEAEEKRR